MTVLPERRPAARVAGQLANSDYFVLGICIVTIVIFAIAAPGFLSPDNLWSILVFSLPLLMLATGQTLVLITAGIDLSIAAAVGFCSVVGALVMNADTGWMRGQPGAAAAGFAAMMGAGALVGFLNGACIAFLRMPAFMVTLTAMMFWSGFAVWLAKQAVNAESIYNLPEGFLVLGRSPWVALLLAALALISTHLLLMRTLSGRWLYAAGENPRAARMSGVPVESVIVAAYVLSGLFAALASVLLTARLETGSPALGRALLLDVIGAAVIGGTSLFGGRGKVLWTVYGVLFLAVLSNGLILMNLSDFVITIIKGAVILMAALLDTARTRWIRVG